MANILQPFAHVVVKFFMDGKEYSVSKFKVTFAQSIDYKGQPESEVTGGHLLVTLSQAVDDNLYLWAKKEDRLKSGEVIFQTDLGISVLRVVFTNAYCVNLDRNFSALTGTETLLVLSPERVSVNGVEHNNFW